MNKMSSLQEDASYFGWKSGFSFKYYAISACTYSLRLEVVLDRDYCT